MTISPDDTVGQRSRAALLLGIEIDSHYYEAAKAHLVNYQAIPTLFKNQ